MGDASLKEAWLEEKKLEWERNQQQREQRLALAKAPVGATRAAPVEPDDAALKREWLRRKRREHEAMRAGQERQRSELVAPAEPDDAALKKEWLRRQRLEHEQRTTQAHRSLSAFSAPEEPDDAALKREWLRRQREMHERALASRAAQPAEAERAPMVDSSLLSTTDMPSERDLYLQQLHDERSFSQRERRQMEGLAQRRPSVPLALPAPEDAAAMELALANMDDEQYAYYFNYAECYEQEQEALSTTSAAASQSSTTRSTTTVAERAEAEGLDELEALEAMRTMELQASGRRQTRSDRSPSAGSSHSRGSSPGRSRPTSAHHRLVGLSPGILPAPRRGSHSGEYYESLLPSPTLGPTLGHSSLTGGSCSERGRGGGGMSADLHDVSGAHVRPPSSLIVEQSHGRQQQRQARDLPGGEGKNPALVALTEVGDGDQGGFGGEREGSPLGFSLGFGSPRGSSQSSPGSSVHSPSMGAPLSPRSSAVLRLEDITVLKRR